MSIPPGDVRRVRRVLGETQEAFAKRFSVTKLTVARWETGDRDCSGLYARQVAQLDKSGELQQLNPVPKDGKMSHKYATIALFNHKGGVSKTTTTFNLGWTLANMGKKVLMVDADPQCNLTGMALALSGQDDFEKLYKKNQNTNLYEALRPAFEALPERLKAVECFEIPKRSGLYLLPGHVKIAEYDIPLGVAHELTGSFSVLKNLPGAIAALIRETALALSIDYVLVDLSPAISSLNQNFFMSSSHFLVPCNPDYFCSLAIDSLTDVLPRWAQWSGRALASGLFDGTAYPVPTHKPLFLGTINQRFRPRYGNAASAFQMWINRINEKVGQNLVPAFKANKMLLKQEVYKDMSVKNELYNLANIADFNSLIARSQDYNVPVFELTDEQLKTKGTVLENMQTSREEFKKLFKLLAQSIVKAVDKSGLSLVA